LLIFGTVAAGFLGVASFQGYLEDMSDPIARNERALEILGAEAMPEGYTAQLYFTLPRLVSIVFLTDGEPIQGILDDDTELTDAQMGEHLFAYISVWDKEKKLDPFHETSSGQVRVDAGVRVRSLEELGEGTFDFRDSAVRYQSHRGELITDQGKVFEGLYSTLQVDCGDFDRHARFALWFYQTTATDDPTGTPVEAGAIESFLEPFDFCR
jgi:hypothetical protein